MLPHEPGIRLAVGVSRSGKTFGMERDVTRASERIPVVVIDRLAEWGRNGFPPDVAQRTAIVSSFDRVQRALERGKRLVVVRSVDARADAERACEWARDRAGVAGVAIPEAHRCFPNAGNLPRSVEDVACAWRHHEVAIWLDTQRLAKLHKDLTEQASACELRLYAILGARDRKVIAEDLDGDLLDPLNTIRDRFKGGDGERGWHVLLPGAPPYEPRREA